MQPHFKKGDLRELGANLTEHHLRIGGKMDTVSQETEVVPTA